MPWSFHGKDLEGTSLVVQWLGHGASMAGDMNSLPGHGTKMPCGAAKKKKTYKINYKALILFLSWYFAFWQHH